MKRSEAIRLRSIVELSAASLDDKTASTAVPLFPRMKGSGELVKAGTRINWKGAIKKAGVDLWDTAENNPDNAPNLWADLDYIDGYRIIPETITVTTAFQKDELGWWADVLYRSKVDANVYNPAQYPDNWEMVE